MSLKPRVEVAFGGRWYDDPATMTWTDVTGYSELVPRPFVRATRGRSGSMDRTPQPGSFSVTFNGLDGAFIPENPASPFYPDVQPGLPIRLSLQDDTGSWVPVFTGFCTDFTPGVSPGSINGATNWTVVDVSAVDGWARVMQAGKRLTYRDRVLTDLAGGRDLAWITAVGQLVEEARSTGVHSGSVVAQDLQAFGFGWWSLTGTGLLTWDEPGASGVLGESGGGDSSGIRLITLPGGSLQFVSTSGFASDRYGGRWQASYSDSSKLVQSAAAEPGGGGQDPLSNVRQQVSVGRPPKQLLPASALLATGWTAGSGTLTDVDALTLAWPARSDAFDPATGSRTATADGPERALSWTGQSSGAFAVTNDTFPVVAGNLYAVHAGVNAGSRVRLRLRWLDSGGATISESIAPTSALTTPVVLTTDSTVMTAPVNAVAARVVLNAQSTSLIQVHGVGVYDALPTGIATSTGNLYLTPVRWWPHGASDHLYAWLQVPLTNPSAIGVSDPSGHRLWLHGQVQVDGWSNGQIHSLGWNVSPGQGGKPALWSEDTSAVSWRLTWPGRDVGWFQGTTVVPASAQWSLGQGNGSRYNISLNVLNPTQPSTITTAWGVIGTDLCNASPSDALVTRWHVPYGAPTTVTLQGTTAGTTDVVMAQLLDALAWPTSQRALTTGTVSTNITWTDGTQGDYGQEISNLAAAEFGWAGVDASGALVWRPMRYYDPDGDGTTVAKAHLTYKAGIAGQITYQVGLGQSMSEDKVINQVNVTSSSATNTALLEDYDSQQRIGIRREELANNAWNQANVDAVAAEVLALYGRPVLVPDKVTVQAVGPDDPNLSVLLGLNPADVVLVTIPRAPAADLTVSALVGQVSLTSDGRRLGVELALGPCPVTATEPAWTGPVFVGLDASGPYVDPARAETLESVSVDAQGYFYDPAGSLSVAVDADGPYVLEGS